MQLIIYEVLEYVFDLGRSFSSFKQLIKQVSSFRRKIVFIGIFNAMKSIHILISILVHIATALSGRSFGDSHHHAIHRRAAPSPRADGVCYTYTIQQGDNCAKLAGRYQITVGNIESWNTGAWDWRGCDNVKQGDFVCLSSGALPMPVALPRATCGPQVPGTKRPARYADLASLNPCPLDQCVRLIHHIVAFVSY